MRGDHLWADVACLPPREGRLILFYRFYFGQLAAEQLRISSICLALSDLLELSIAFHK
jgi:hypothetical protein